MNKSDLAQTLARNVYQKTSMKTQRVVIVGAGVAGSILARKLAKLPNIEVVCLERVDKHDHREAGTGLNLGPNAVKALTAFDNELALAVSSASLPWRTWQKSLTSGRQLFNVNLRDFTDYDGWRIRWSDLYRVLRDGAGNNIRYGCEIIDISPDSDSPTATAIAWNECGQRHTLDRIDLLIGADGRYSQVRNKFSGAPSVSQLGIAVFRILVSDTSGGLIEDHEQWFNGPNRLLAFRVKPNDIYIAGSFPVWGSIATSMKSPSFLRKAYTPQEAPPSPAARWLIESVCANVSSAHWARMQDHALLYGAEQRNVLYVGDAAHGMVPTLGQGATQAMEGACHAADLITREVMAGRRDPREWIKLIEIGRTERINFVMEFSREASSTMLQGGDAVVEIMSKMNSDFLAKLRRLWCELPELASPPI